MEISGLGHACFRLKGREATVVPAPCPPATGYKIGRVQADLVTISNDSPESSYRQAIAGDVKCITGPGAFEIAGVLVTGVRTDHAKAAGGPQSRNVASVTNIDDVH